jgi:hypothetical protein
VRVVMHVASVIITLEILVQGSIVNCLAPMDAHLLTYISTCVLTVRTRFQFFTNDFSYAGFQKRVIAVAWDQRGICLLTLVHTAHGGDSRL